CVKFAVNKIMHRKPDLLVSGINHGTNMSINVIYSGTMSAAVEGAIEGIPSVGFSLSDHTIDADFTASKKIAKSIASKVLQHGLPLGVCLN
ncbi:5'/3'-nucleotidase SurE, partial [Bacillus cereus group sp. BC306]|uniref:5'/3'-nucleotidase SurE n=1 Tax=Bacillus cereus group sp. BC306 TaxID=3445320 RepID=UPI003F22F263